MKKILAVAVVSMLCASLSLAGERVVCKIWLDDGGVVARSTAPAPLDIIAGRFDTTGLALASLDGTACPAIRLQDDGGILSRDGGLELTDVNGQANTDGGVAGCSFCDLRGARSVALQCKDPVYYSEKWDGGVDRWNQRGVVPATANDILIDFDSNPDGYRIDLRGTGNAISVKPVTASASNTCTVSTINRNVP